MTPTERLLTPRFVLVVVVGLCYFLALGVLLPTLPLLVTDGLRGGELAVGIVVGTFAVGAVIVRPWAGRLGDQLGRRLLVITGPAVVGLSIAAYHLADGNLAALVAVRLVGGIGEAATFVGAATMITDLSPEHRRGEAMSYWSVAIYGGLGLGPALGEIALGGDRSFDRVWLVSWGLCLAATVLALFTRETLASTPVPAGAGGTAQRAPLLHPAALVPGTVLFLTLIGLAGFNELIPLYVPEVGMENSRAVFFTYGLSVLAVRVLGARIPDRVGPRRAATAATLVGAAGFVVLSVVAQPAGVFGGTVVFALGMSLLFPALSSLALSGLPAHERGSAIGTVSSFFDASQGVGAAVMGLLASLTGYRGAFAGAAVSCLAACALLRARVPHEAEPPEDEDLVPAAVTACDAGHL